MKLASLLLVTAACHATQGRFPLRDPFTLDTDLHPVSVACRPDPTKKEPKRVSCMPVEYVSPFIWNQIDDIVFERLSRVLSLDVVGEAANANSLDEVADSAWFTNRTGEHALTREQLPVGACRPEDNLPDEVEDGTWVIDHGKDNGSTPGFRVNVPDKGLYLLKADDPTMPERASAASVIGAAIYNAIGFATSCEQIVYIRREQLKLTPGLVTIDNAGVSHPFDDAALDKVLKTTAHKGNLYRFQASKWLPGVPIGPFTYDGTRKDDPNDVVDHENRRELRGSRVLAAWLNHWDSREQNSMDVWVASDPKDKRSSPGYVRHYILDTSDTLGGEVDPKSMARRLGFSYTIDFGDVLEDLFTLGIFERHWDHAESVKGREKFGFFTARDFDPESWKGLYPNPAFHRMTERDSAWMARLIARLSPEDVRAIVAAGEFSDPTDVDYLTGVLIERQRRIFAAYLTYLSPIADLERESDGRICGVDLARLRDVFVPEQFRYQVIEQGGGRRMRLPAEIRPGGVVCFKPVTVAPEGLPDDAEQRVVIFHIDNGTGAGPLEIHTYDLGARGMRVVGLVRPRPRGRR